MPCALLLLAAAATPHASGVCSARDAAAPTTAPSKTSCVEVVLSYCNPKEGRGAVTEGLLAKRPLVGPLPLLRLLVDKSKSPLREAALDFDVSEAAGGAGGFVSLLRFFPNFFLPVVVVVVVVALMVKALVLLLGSEAVVRFNEVIITWM